MSKRYNEIMEKIEVTPEMRMRILNNISVENPKMSASARNHKFAVIKRYLPVAACFALIIAASAFMPSLKTGTTADKSEIVQFSNDIVDLNSLKELSEAVGFDVKELTALPFTPSETLYTFYPGNMAEVRYMDDEKDVSFRMSEGLEDNSGDYNVYKNKTEITVGSLNVLLKGNDAGYALALWNDGSFSYSVSASSELSENDWKGIIEGLK